MRLLISSCLLLLLVANIEARNRYQTVLWRVAREIATNATWRAEFERQIDPYDPGSQAVFDCDVTDRSPGVPTSVHKLRPSDVKVVAAMGDSITAGNGIDASNAVEVLLQFRGESWSGGGDQSLDEGVVTLPNVLKKYNPDLKGFSRGYGNENSKNAWFNVAVAGGKAGDLVDEADMLIERMKADTQIDFNKDWKLITLLIGGNNLCDYCWNRELHSPESVGAGIKAALDKLHAALPRALVNLVPMADITPVPHIKTGWFCHSIHVALCRCATDTTTQDEIRPVQLGYYNQMRELAESGRYDTRDDFTVVLQPFLKDQDFVKKDSGKYDPTYIAPDCFHPNRKSHQGLSVLLWNSMFTPVGEKFVSTPNDDLLHMEYKCPSKRLRDTQSQAMAADHSIDSDDQTKMSSQKTHPTYLPTKTVTDQSKPSLKDSRTEILEYFKKRNQNGDQRSGLITECHRCAA